MTIPPAEKKAVDGSLPTIPALLAVIMNAFRTSYIPPGVDPADPRMSVLTADPLNFPDHVLIITANKDRLAPEAEKLAAKVKTVGR
jgi:acetyl esterase/lipase